jgi:integral membrane protein (TIGR01906 family)
LIDIVATKNGQSFDLFNQKEILHLKDVKGLVQLDYAALIFSTLYVLIFGAIFLARKTGHWQQLAGSIVQGSLLSLGLIALLGIISLIDFNWLFVQFHLLSFANDLWLLNPDTDYLIMMFPQGFWVDAALLWHA